VSGACRLHLLLRPLRGVSYRPRVHATVHATSEAAAVCGRAHALRCGLNSRLYRGPSCSIVTKKARCSAQRRVPERKAVLQPLHGHMSLRKAITWHTFAWSSRGCHRKPGARCYNPPSGTRGGADLGFSAVDAADMYRGVRWNRATAALTLSVQEPTQMEAVGCLLGAAQ
jgi:hypothetical protein